MAKMGARKGLQCVGITTAEIRSIARRLFPNLKPAEFVVTSCPSRAYNCIAWAADKMDAFWWPVDGYWPPGVPRERTVASFIQAFETLGYAVCGDSDVRFEPSFDKIAIFAKDGLPTHAARQLGPQIWSSKLGTFADISHRLSGVEGDQYGRSIVVMKRPHS